MKLRHARWGLVVLLTTITTCSDGTGPSGQVVTLGRRLATGEQVGCALKDSGDILCWGLNSVWWEYGVSPSAYPAAITPTSPVVPKLVSLAAGASPHLCGIKVDSTAVCWGRNSFGELGSGFSGLTGDSARAVFGGYKWADLSVARLTTCGVTVAGAGFCWGYNQQGEIGSSSIPIATPTPIPNPIEGGHLFSQVAAGWLHACGIVANGDAYCWGGNAVGQLGIGVADTFKVRSPTLVLGGRTWRTLSLGARYSCGIATDSLAYCWGDNSTGELGDSTLTLRTTPTRVAGGHKFAMIATGGGFNTGAANPVSTSGNLGHTCAVDYSGSAYCWGSNANGQVGDGTMVDKSAPALVAGGLTFSRVSVGGAYSCGMKDSNVWCWGSNLFGQVGGPDANVIVSTPKPVKPPFGP